MIRRYKWLAGLGVLAALAAALAMGVAALVPSDEELARQAEARLEAALGVPVSVGAVRWQILPLPAVIVRDVTTKQERPVTVRELVAWVNLRPLFDRIVSVESVEVDGAVVPQLSLREFEGKGKDKREDAALDGKFKLAPVPLEHLRFTNLTWISRRGIPVVYEGEIDFEQGWRPSHAQIRRPGIKPDTALTLTRHAGEDRWQTRITVGGGTAHGEVRLKPNANGTLHLSGELAPKGIEIAGAVTTFNRRPVVSGRATGSTVLASDGRNMAEMMRSLHTQTQFSISPATILRFDLDKAIRSFGKEHQGQTGLESLTGQMDTQNTGDGTIWTYTQLKGRSGALTASGEATLFNRKIEARAAVDLVDGLIGVPVKVSGTLDKPEVTVPKGSIAGAVIGTAILPGIGTAIGARLGAMFGRDPAPQPAPLRPPAPRTPPRPAAPRAP